MAASVWVRCLPLRNRVSSPPQPWRSLSSDVPRARDGEGVKEIGKDGSAGGGSTLSRFARAVQTYRDTESARDERRTSPRGFASILRPSKLMQIGNPEFRVVLGTVVDVVSDDLYIDFGGKFHCVCKRPVKNPQNYYRGVKVKIKLHDMEMTSAFLGSTKHVTLLEADATLIGLRRSKEDGDG